MPTISLLRRRFYASIVTMIVALQLVNVSIDPVDPSHFEDLSINEIESCIELVIEVVLGHDNAIQETEDHDHSSFKPVNTFVLFNVSRVSHTFENSLEVVSAPGFIHNTSLIPSPTRAILLPPPKLS